LRLVGCFRNYIMMHGFMNVRFMILCAAVLVHSILWQQYYLQQYQLMKQALLPMPYSIKLLYIIRQLKHVLEQLR